MPNRCQLQLKSFLVHQSAYHSLWIKIIHLSEVTHKRRISALGPGGLTRERAGFRGA